MAKNFENEKYSTYRPFQLPIDGKELDAINVELIIPSLPITFSSYNYIGEVVEKYDVLKIEYEVICELLCIRICLKKMWEKTFNTNSAHFVWSVVYPDTIARSGDEFLYAMLGEHVFLDFSVKVNESGTYKLHLEMN